MLKWYREFFYVPKHEKIREKVMVSRVISTVSIIVVCLVAMGFTAYAYFSHNVTSSANYFKTAKFEASVSIQIVGADGNTVDVSTITSNYRSHKAELAAGEVYTVTIAPTTASTADTGFIVVTAENCTHTYHTQQLGVDENANGGRTPSITFELTVSQATTVVFLTHWGTSSYYDAYENRGVNEEWYITTGETVAITVDTPVTGTTDTTAVTTTMDSAVTTTSDALATTTNVVTTTSDALATTTTAPVTTTVTAIATTTTATTTTAAVTTTTVAP